MIGFLRGKPVSQVDSLLINGQEFGEEQIKRVLKDVKADKKTKGKKK